MAAPQWHNVFRKNASFQGMTEILDDAQIPWTVEAGGAHQKLVFEVAGRVHKHVLSTSSVNLRTVKKSACDIRRILRAAGIGNDSQSQEQVMDSNCAVPAVVPDISLVTTNGDPRARDLDLAERLGFERPRDTRKILARHRGALEEFGEVVVEAGQYRGQSTETWFLNEGQALYAAAVSEAPNAHPVRVMLVRTFMAWRHGQLQPAIRQSEDTTAALELVLEQLSALSMNGGISDERMRELLRQHCEWEDSRFAKVIRAAFASGHNVVTALSGKRTPQIAADDEIDIDAVYRACSLPEHLPARRRLSSLVRNRLDAYCQDRRIPTGANISLGQRVRTWPRQAVLAWYAEGGREFIAAHIKAHTVDGQSVIDFPSKVEAR